MNEGGGAVSRVTGALVGLAVGDALGLPVEFEPRSEREADPVCDMRPSFSWKLAPGTWSDDTALALCLAESICEKGFDPQDAGERFVSWMDRGLWSATGEAIGIGGATRRALERVRAGVPAVLSGGRGENDNGNGSLMRILPASIWLSSLPEPARLRAIAAYSAITHGHPRSMLGCYLHCLVAGRLLAGEAPGAAYAAAMDEARSRLAALPPTMRAEAPAYGRILDCSLASASAASVRGSGYVVHCLEAALWCLLNTSDYRSCVLAAVNLGEDSDTTAAVDGGLAGLVYGRASVPGEWVSVLARRSEIESLAGRFASLIASPRVNGPARVLGLAAVRAHNVKVILVSYPATDSPEALPLGAASVAAAIKQAWSGAPRGGADVAVLEAKLGEAPSALASRVLAERPGVVGLSVYSWSRDALRDAARLIRSSSPHPILFAGGPEVTADPASALRDLDLDFAVVGEGERATARAITAIAPSLEGGSGFEPDALRDIAGIALPGRAWKRAPAEDPATLPSPWLLGTIKPEDCCGDIVWELSRGCPFKCAYCYESKGEPGSRPFPMKRIEAELELFKKAGVSYAFILDPTFDSNPKRALEVLDLFRLKAPGMRWKFELRAELLDKALVRRFSELDCTLQIGLQSARPETLATVGRPGFDRRDFGRRIVMLGQAGVSFGLDLIYGLPGDGLRDFKESLDFALGLEPNHLDLFPLALLPGTELAERAAELGIEADDEPPYLVRRTRELTPEDLAQERRLAQSCDRFYSSGRAVGWFSAMLKSLRQRPSGLLGAFASWRDAERQGAKAGESQAVIESEQLLFLEESFKKAGLDAQWPAASDLVRLHGAWTRALAEGEETIFDLNYDPEEALGAAELGLAVFSREASVSPGRWRVAPDDEEGARIESCTFKK
jgi:ADP-ribosylglycohydrolase/radical SAM superfamily enzyme YgiQ (UPF0313 family)